MVYIDFTVRFHHGADKVWAALTDWESHSQWIPFTRIIILDNGVDCAKGLGTIFIDRTGFGKLSFDDKMQVDRFLRPKDNEKGVGKVSIKKLSSFIKGSAAFQVCIYR